IPEGECSGDGCCGLIAGIAASADKQRHKQREHGDLRKRVFKHLKHLHRECCADSQHEQPHNSRLYKLRDRCRQIRPPQWLHATLTCGVFALSLLNNSYRVIKGEKPHDSSFAIHHGNRHEAALEQTTSGILSILTRLDIHGFAHDRRDVALRFGSKKIAKTHEAGNVPCIVEHGKHVNCFGIRNAVFESQEGFFDREIHASRYEIRGHAAPDRLLRVAKNHSGLLPFQRSEAAQKLLCDGRGKLVEQPHAVVCVKLREQLSYLTVLKPMNNVTLERRVKRFKHLERSVFMKQPVNNSTMTFVQPFEYQHGVAGTERFKRLCELNVLLVTEQAYDAVYQLIEVNF